MHLIAPHPPSYGHLPSWESLNSPVLVWPLCPHFGAHCYIADGSMGAGVDYQGIVVNGWPPEQSRRPSNDITTGGHMSIDVAIPGCDDWGGFLDRLSGGTMGERGGGGDGAELLLLLLL